MTLGVLPDVPEDVYHADTGSLSVSGAKLLLPPSCPALFKWRRDNGQPHKDVFDFGHAAHKAVLGVGAEIRYITGKDAKGNPSDTWGTKDAKEQKAKAHADGAIPLLESDRGVIEGMTSALRAHPEAAALLNPDHGAAEQSLYWVDDPTGVQLRGRLDWLPHARPGRRFIVADYKTAATANPALFGKAAASFGYHMQDAMYTDAVTTLGLDDDPAFVFILQEKTPPYLVSVVQLDQDARAIGRQLNRQAIDLYAQCEATGTWPGYATGVTLASLPSWYRNQIGIDSYDE